MNFPVCRFRIHAARVLILCALLLTVYAHADAQNPPLPSWNHGPARQAIISFVRKVRDKSGTNYVEPQDRFATFDQDGTLRVEHPLYTQTAFALARVHELAPKHGCLTTGRTRLLAMAHPRRVFRPIVAARK